MHPAPFTVFVFIFFSAVSTRFTVLPLPSLFLRFSLQFLFVSNTVIIYHVASVFSFVSVVHYTAHQLKIFAMEEHVTGGLQLRLHIL